MKEPVMIRCPECGFGHWRPKARVSRPGVMACHRCGVPIAFQGGEWRTHKDKWGTLIPELVIPPRKP